MPINRGNTKNGDWDRFASRSNPLVLQPVACTDGVRLVVQPSRTSKIFGGVVAAIATGVIVFAVVQLEPWSYQWCVGLLIGGLFLCAGFLLLLAGGRVLMMPPEDLLVLRYGFWPFVRAGRFQLADVRFYTRQCDLGQGTKIELVVRHSRKQGLVHLARGGGWEIQAIADAIQGCCTLVDDASRIQVVLPAGKQLSVSTIAAAPDAASFRNARLRIGPERVVIVPTWKSRIFDASFLVVGCVALCFGFFGAQGWGQLICLAVGTIFATAGVVLPVIARRVKFDRILGRMTCTGMLARTQELPLDNVAALQICTRWVDSDNRPYQTFELNAVLHDPPGLRLTLMSHANEPSMCEDAASLAAWLAVPLLNHTDVARASRSSNLQKSDQQTSTSTG